MPKHYVPTTRWRYRIPILNGTVRTGEVLLSSTTNNRKEDEAFARYLLRDKFNLTRLPPVTVVWPSTDE